MKQDISKCMCTKFKVSLPESLRRDFPLFPLLPWQTSFFPKPPHHPQQDTLFCPSRSPPCFSKRTPSSIFNPLFLSSVVSHYHLHCSSISQHGFFHPLSWPAILSYHPSCAAPLLGGAPPLTSKEMLKQNLSPGGPKTSGKTILSFSF